MFLKKIWGKKLKKMDMWDISLIKLTMIAFTLAMITTFGILMTWTHKVNPFWFWGFFLLFAVRPMMKWFKK